MKKTLLVAAVGMLALQLVLVGVYLAVNRQDPIILNPDRGLDDNGITMVMFCGQGSDREELDKVPPDGNFGPWSRGRTIRGNCDIWYHDGVLGGGGNVD
jgi:hypothetical protein